jgi:hypothetical protein
MIEKKIIWEKWKEIQLPENEEDNDKPTLFMTPLGYLSHKLYPGIKNSIKFWVGHTNFDIDEFTAHIIDVTEGVELFNIFTRYRFRVSPGKIFKMRDVAQNIEINLGCNGKAIVDEATFFSIKALKLKLQQAKLPYAIYVLPNGTYEFTQKSNNEKFQLAVEGYKYLEKTIGGYILSSGV